MSKRENDPGGCRGYKLRAPSHFRSVQGFSPQETRSGIPLVRGALGLRWLRLWLLIPLETEGGLERGGNGGIRSMTHLRLLAGTLSDTCQVEPHARVNCGFSGITAEQCEKKGCCFDTKVTGVPWCFNPVAVDDPTDNGKAMTPPWV